MCVVYVSLVKEAKLHVEKGHFAVPHRLLRGGTPLGRNCSEVPSRAVSVRAAGGMDIGSSHSGSMNTAAIMGVHT